MLATFTSKSGDGIVRHGLFILCFHPVPQKTSAILDHGNSSQGQWCQNRQKRTELLLTVTRLP